MKKLQPESWAFLAFVLLSSCSRLALDKTVVAPPVKSIELGLTVPRAFQATYYSPKNFVYHTQHVYSDGQGRLRIDILGDSRAPTAVHVLDLNTDKTLAWVEGEKKYISRHCQPTDPVVMWLKATTMPRDNVESLGVRNVNGHVCTGYRHEGTTIWYDNEYNCPVESDSGAIAVSLTEFSPKPPAPSMFSPPSDYVLTQSNEVRMSVDATDRQRRSRIFSDIQRHIH